MKRITTKPYAPRLRTYRTPRTGAGQPARNRSLSTRDVGSFVREMTKLHDTGTLSKDHYQQLVLLACSAYVQQEAENYLGEFEDRLGKFLEKTFSPERLARVLSPSR